MAQPQGPPAPLLPSPLRPTSEQLLLSLFFRITTHLHTGLPGGPAALLASFSSEGASDGLPCFSAACCAHPSPQPPLLPGDEHRGRERSLKFTFMGKSRQEKLQQSGQAEGVSATPSSVLCLVSPPMFKCK